VDPFAGLPASKMSMDTWKKTYSNSKTDYYAAMVPFWNEQLDKENYSIWFCNYNYNEELAVAFMCSNQIGGFIQRTDEIRRYTFGTMIVFGEEKPFTIEGCWLIRGKSIQPLLDCNPDAEYYTWTQANVDDAAVRERVGKYWCEGTAIDGRVVYDSKVFK
jgi:elongation factor 1-gamma